MKSAHLATVAAALLGSCAPAPPPAGAANLVVSERAPALTLRVADGFVPLPPMHFPIEDLTLAERRIFVDAGADRRLRRMIVVQFEQVRPGSDFRFVFPSTPPRRFGAETYRAGAFVYDDERAAARAPDREAGLTRAHLAGLGYRSPRLWRVARLARVSDPEGLSEVILFYMENADGDFPDGTLPGADADGDLTLEGAAREAMLERLERHIEAVRG